jgi:hypothetical protein
MTAFIKDNFYGSEYVDYNIDGKSKFVARFKYKRGSKGSFITFLIKNFTVEEYFGRLDATCSRTLRSISSSWGTR